MKLYYHPISTYSQKVLIAFYEKGLAFEPQIVQLMDPDAGKKYRNVYPMGKIPCLVLDDGHLIPESSIIIDYIDRLAKPTLLNNDPTKARKIRFKDRMFDLYLNDNVVTLLFQNMKPENERDKEKIERARFQIKNMYESMDKDFADQPFANGAEFTMSDCAAAPALFYAQQNAPFDQYRNICTYWDRLSSRPSVRRTQEEAAPAIAAFMGKDAA